MSPWMKYLEGRCWLRDSGGPFLYRVLDRVSIDPGLTPDRRFQACKMRKREGDCSLLLKEKRFASLEEAKNWCDGQMGANN